MKDLLLYTNDLNRATAEVESLGGHVRHQFTPFLFVAVVPEGATLSASAPEPPPQLDDVTRMMAEAWNARRGCVRADEGIPWDTPGFEPPC